MSYFGLLVALAKVRSKKRRPHLPILSSTAIVHTDLSPRGSVLASGELWNAEAVHAELVRSEADVTVVGFRGHVLLVQERSRELVAQRVLKG